MARQVRSGMSLAYGTFTRFGKVAFLLPMAFFAGAASAQEVTIAALGDSLTAGYGLAQDAGFVPQLEAWLHANGQVDVRIINAGVSGDTTAGGLARVEWTLTDDVDAMIVALGGNDLLRAIPPEASRENLRGILQAAQEGGVEVLLVGLHAPGNYGPEYQQAFDAIFPELAAEFGTLHAESFFMGLEIEDPVLISGYMQADGIHPNATGVTAIVEALGPFVQELVIRASTQ